ncbi:MAG: acyltransferase family protein [Candidatus Binatia bacterium]
MAVQPTPLSKTLSTTELQRYHAFDSLRAVMMLLGLVLHSAMGYVTFPTERVWPFKDLHPSVFFDLLVMFIHTFRMPVFFVIAGFFAAFLYITRGTHALFHNRTQRIALPLACGWIVLFPLVIVASGFAHAYSSVQIPVDPNDLTIGRLLNHLMHLWFLYDLLILYGAALLILPLVQRIPRTIRERVLDVFGWIVPHIWGPVVFSLVTMLTLYPMQEWALDTSDSFLPPLRILAAYGVFFSFGWFLYNRRMLLATFSQRAWGTFVVGVLFFGLYVFCIGRAFTAGPIAGMHILAIGSLAAAMWFFIYGFLGLFLRYLEKPLPLARYMADASYWMYLVHLPCTIVLPAFLNTLLLSAFVKFGVVLGATTFLTVVTYHYWVRATVIGQILNGRRYPRRLPHIGLQPPLQQGRAPHQL